MDEWLIRLLFLLLGGLLSLVMRHYATWPRLKIIGAGGGGNNTFSYLTVRFKNAPGFLGLPIHRSAAVDCEARLLDPETGSFIAGRLMWASPKNPNNLEYLQSIGPGEERTLYIFGRFKNESTVFVYESVSGRADETPQPSGNAKFTPPLILHLHIQDANGMTQRFKTLRIEKEKFTDKITWGIDGGRSSA